MKVSVITLGCKVNEYESQSIMNEFLSAGYEVGEGLIPADIYVVNTCSVTNIGDRKSRQVLAKIEKLNPKAKVVVCGCSVQNNPDKFLSHPQVVAAIGNEGKYDILNALKHKTKKLKTVSKDYQPMLRPISTRARQYIKIQDGCDYFCSYCIIPYLRGRSRSRDLNDIIDEIKNTKASEIVLTGINMSDYRIDGKLALKELIKAVDKLNVRFRISSIECNVLDDEMIDILKNSKNFCPHFHLSLQSACNETLKRMNRRYSIEQFMSIVDKLKAAFPTASISTDIIVGFKGETDEEFDTTLKNLQRIQFSFMHVFPYSIRTGTVASKLGGDVDKCKVKARERVLLDLDRELRTKFYDKNVNMTHSVLIEETKDGKSMGYTDNYIYTYVNGKYPSGQILNVKPTEKYLDGMKGEIEQ